MPDSSPNLKTNEKNTQPDKDVAANERSVPSQAEGDRETIEEDLENKDRKNI